MTSFPDPASGSSLEAGLAAIKQGNYPEAIQLLERFLATQAGAIDQPNALKAQMGLVTAYARSGRSKQAAHLCRELNRSSHAKVRAWATRTLGEIWEAGRGSQSAGETDSTGFVPLEEAAQTSGERRPLTGNSKRAVFVPQNLANNLATDGETDETDERSVASQESLPNLNVPSSTALQPTSPLAASAARVQRWQSLNQLNSARLQWAEMGTAIALFLVTCGLYGAIALVPIYWLRFATSVLKWSAYIPSLRIPFLAIFLGLGVLFAASPWLLDALLKGLYRMQPLSTGRLAHHSPESHRMIQRVCQQRQMPLPQLEVLPTQIPLSFTYGCHPKFARIVVSQGLLEQLSDDEIATIYASELGHILHWDFSLMAWLIVVLQIPYTLYWKAAEAGDWLRDSSEAGKRENALIAFLLGIAADLLAIAASISYGLYRLLRCSGLWLSRERVIYSDRAACNLTGNPNGLTRALLKIAVGTAQNLQQQNRTDYLLEGFDLLTPLGCLSAINLGSLYPHTSLKSLLAWDQVNPDRHWLALNNSHPLVGDRLQRLTNYAHHWQVEPELSFDQPAPIRNQRSLLLQGAPFFGILFGYLAAQFLWFVAQILYRLGMQQISWLASDYDLFASFMLLGFGLGTFLRFNSFFPDLQKIRRVQTTNSEAFPALPDLLTQPNARPIDPQPIRLEGRLLGRSGIANWLGQDLILQTSTGCIKLHYVSQLGVIGNLLPPHPADVVNEAVIVTGWFRRGATSWIDADTIRTSNGRILCSGHQVWSTALAGIATLVAIVLIF